MTTIEYLIDAAFDSACNIWDELMESYYKREVTEENYKKATEELKKYILEYNEGLNDCGIGKARISEKRAEKEARKYLSICIEKADSGKMYFMGDSFEFGDGAFLANH